MTYTYNLIQTLMLGIKNPSAAFPPSDGWTQINTTKDLSAFMDSNPNREYFIVWVSHQQLTFDYSHPKTSPLSHIDAGSGEHVFNSNIRMLDKFSMWGGRAFIKAGSTVKPDLPTNVFSKIYNAVVEPSPTDCDYPDPEVILIEAIRLIDGTWTGYTKDGYSYTGIKPADIKNFQIDPPRK